MHRTINVYPMKEEEKKDVASADVAPPSARSVALERLRKRHPESEYSEDDDDALYGALNADMDEYESELEGLRGREQKLIDMFEKDHRTTAFLASWANGENPYVAMARVFGSELFEKADDPEFVEELSKANEEYLQRMNRSKELDEAWKQNFSETMDMVNRLEEEGVPEEDVQYALETMARIIDDGIVGKMSEEHLRMIISEKHKEQEIADARHEAEVKGRNAKIAEMKKSARGGDGVTSLGGSTKGNDTPRHRGIFGLASEAR